MGLGQDGGFCQTENDNLSAKKAVATYDETTQTAMIHGIPITLSADAIAKALELAQKPENKAERMTEVTISQWLNESEEETQQCRNKKQGVPVSGLPNNGVYKFLVGSGHEGSQHAHLKKAARPFPGKGTPPIQG